MLNGGNILGLFGQVVFSPLTLKSKLGGSGPNAVVGCRSQLFTFDEQNFGKHDKIKVGVITRVLVGEKCANRCAWWWKRR